MTIDQVKKLNPPITPGCYQFFNMAGKIIYIGKAVNLKNRVLSYWQKNHQLTPAKQQMIKEVKKIKWLTVDSEIEALLLEANLIKKHQPFYNIDKKDDKRFCYIKISLEDEVPGVFMTRKIDKSGQYFGPFVSAQAVRETLKALRKIWPYCQQRRLGKLPCFYYQIGRCVGVCGGKISVVNYKQAVIKPIILFLVGKKQKIILNLKCKILKLEKKDQQQKISVSEKDELLGLRWQLKNMEQVLVNAQVLSVGEKYANDVVELAKILNLDKVPQRIEGYDLSNIFGQEAVGSMAVFHGGEADKNEYRKFKISNFQFSVSAQFSVSNFQKNTKHGDVQMLEEVLERRFNNDWPLPNLIIVDGGKAQLNVALKILKKFKLDILAIAITKGEGLRSAAAPDKIFFPQQTKPLQLPLNSPALHMIKRVRDEAHRFAIGYHRQLRSKKMLKK